VQRACGLQDASEHERLKEVVAQMARLPSLPSLYVQIVEALNDPSATIEHIGEIVSQDMAMTAQFLKLVNSAFFGLPRPATSPSEAAMYLGIDTIKALVLSIHTFSQFDGLSCRGFSLDALMHHSLRTAGRAREIAQLEDSNQKIANESFIGGMLHDIGKLLLAANYPKDYEEVARLVGGEGLSHCAAEKEIFGVNHASVGGYLLGLWGLPVAVVEAIALHHSPHRAASAAFCALTAVHAANAFEQERAAILPVAAEDGLDGPYFAALGLTHRVVEWRQTGQTYEARDVLTPA
jgi:HD-like signal output (HDOD) protein